MAKNKIVAGIDIGSAKTATLIAQVDETGKISIVGIASAPTKGVRKSQIVDIEDATESTIASVEAAERMAGYNLSNSYVSIGGGHISSQNSQGVVAVADPSAEVTGEDVDRVIDAAKAVSLASSREVVHVLPREFIVDGESGVKDPVGMSGVRLEVQTHLVTASATAVKNIVKCVSEVGVDVEALVFSGLASAEAVLSETEKELGVLLVDIGAGSTSLAVFLEGALAHSAVFPIGGRNVTNDLAIGMRVSLENAEKIKLSLSKKKKDEAAGDQIRLSSLGIEEEDRAISKKTLTEGIIRPRLNEIFAMVELELKRSGMYGKTPSGVVVTGGGALTVNSVEAGRRVLSLPTRLGVPQGVTGLIDDISSPEYATGVGLIIWGSKLSQVQPKTGSLSKMPKIGFHGAESVQKLVEFVKGLLP